MNTKMKTTLRSNIKGWALVFPSLLLIGLFTIFPVFKAVISSFYVDNLAHRIPVFVGFENYRTLFSEELFLKVLKNTLVFVLATVPLSMLFALFFALMLQACTKKLQPLIRLTWFYPTVIPLVAVANIWLFLYTPDYGMLDSFLSLFGIRGNNWLGNPRTVMPSIIAVYVWKQSGYLMLFFLAGLQQINGEYYEAAKIDGARSFTVFRRITLPLLMPTFLFVFIIAATAAFKTVDHLVIMTRGGPDNASNLLLYYIFETAFSFWDIGKAASMTVVLILLLLVMIILNIRYFDRRIHYQG